MKGTRRTNTDKTEIPCTIILLREKIKELNSQLQTETDEDIINHLQFKIRQYSTELHLLEKVFIQSDIQDIGRIIEEVYTDIDNSVILLTTERTAKLYNYLMRNMNTFIDLNKIIENLNRITKGEDINE